VTESLSTSLLQGSPAVFNFLLASCIFELLMTGALGVSRGFLTDSTLISGHFSSDAGGNRSSFV
jgi:hypothetical protein